MTARTVIVPLLAMHLTAGMLPAADASRFSDVTSGNSAPAPASLDAAAAILTARLTELSRSSPFPGFSVAVVTADGPTYLEGFGWANLETGIHYLVTTTKPIASTSKTVFDVCMMHAVENLRVKLDVPVMDLVAFPVVHPGFPNDGITRRTPHHRL